MLHRSLFLIGGMVLTTFGVAAHVAAAAPELPPYLPHPERLSADARAEVASIWARRTLSRSAVGQPVRVPFELYRLLVDTPEVTAAAGQHLGVGKYRVTRTGDDAFDVQDGEGMRAQYRVVLRTPTERVVLAHAQRATRLVGEVRGATVTVLTLVADVASNGQQQIAQRLDSTVRIEHRVVALIARLLVPMFPQYADRKIGEMFAVAGRVGEWASTRPEEFCAWLGTQPQGARYRDVFAHEVASCAVH